MPPPQRAEPPTSLTVAGLGRGAARTHTPAAGAVRAMRRERCSAHPRRGAAPRWRGVAAGGPPGAPPRAARAGLPWLNAPRKPWAPCRGPLGAAGPARKARLGTRQPGARNQERAPAAPHCRSIASSAQFDYLPCGFSSRTPSRAQQQAPLSQDGGRLGPARGLRRPPGGGCGSRSAGGTPKRPRGPRAVPTGRPPAPGRRRASAWPGRAPRAAPRPGGAYLGPGGH
jgi:hypothetical protein